MSHSNFSEGWKLVYSLLFYIFCYIKCITSGIWRLMPRHLNCLHLLLKVARMTAQRRDISTMQEPPTTHSCLLALALCLLWQGTQGTRSKSVSDQGLQGVPGTVFCPIRATCVQSHLVARGSVTEAASKGLCSFSLLPGYFTGMQSAQTRSRNWWKSKLNPLPHQPV